MIDAAKEAVAIAKGERPAARIHVNGFAYVPELSGPKAAIETVIAYLAQEFIVEECVGNLTDGCLSCEMIETRSSLRKALELLEEASLPSTPNVG